MKFSEKLTLLKLSSKIWATYTQGCAMFMHPLHVLGLYCMHISSSVIWVHMQFKCIVLRAWYTCPWIHAWSIPFWAFSEYLTVTSVYSLTVQGCRQGETEGAEAPPSPKILSSCYTMCTSSCHRHSKCIIKKWEEKKNSFQIISSVTQSKIKA